MPSIAVLINRHARRGSDRAVKVVHEWFPQAKVLLSQSFDETRRWLAEEIAPHPPDVLLAGGGDGTTIGLINALRDLNVPFPAIGALPLGTGNAWARTTRAPPAALAIERLAKHGSQPVPTRKFALVETEGTLAHFAGTGWDAEVIDDYKAWLALPHSKPLRKLSTGLLGYFCGVFSKTIPRHWRNKGLTQVELIQLDDEPALTVDERGRIVPVPNSGAGRVLYRGDASVAAAATTPDWGFGFRAFPFADRVTDLLSVRVYGGTILEATSHVFELWRGHHPVPKMHDFFFTRGKMIFDHDVPFQVGGDLSGSRRTFEFQLSKLSVNLIQWSEIGRPPSEAFPDPDKVQTSFKAPSSAPPERDQPRESP